MNMSPVELDGQEGEGELLFCFVVLLGAVHSGKRTTVVINFQIMKDCLAKRHGQVSCMKRSCKTSEFAFQKLGLDEC